MHSSIFDENDLLNDRLNDYIVPVQENRWELQAMTRETVSAYDNDKTTVAVHKSRENTLSSRTKFVC
jgi:hypothetical protein